MLAVAFHHDTDEQGPMSMSTTTAARLLFVDDDAMNRDLISRRLLRHGYRVELAVDGADALAKVDQQLFDLILLDIMMPGLSGIDVLKKLRETRSRAELPVIMATAKDTSEDIVEALAAGANDYVTKPLDMAVAVARIEGQLALKRAHDTNVVLSMQLEMHNRFIKKTFGRYLSDEIVASLLDQPEGLALGGEKRLVTILMSDLRGFTSVAERLPPEQVVRCINHYLEAMTDVILAHRGTIDEFIGDAILAIFGAPIQRPDDARRAVACALAMQRAMNAVNERNQKDGLPEVEMGIAINTGEVVVGNIGSTKRTKYGVVGSAVNVASRIESHTVGGQVLIADATLQAAGNGVATDGRFELKAKGIPAPIAVHSVVALGALRLERAQTPMIAITPLPVRFTLLSGKDLRGDEHPGEIVSLSKQEADLRCEVALEPLMNLRLRFLAPDGSELATEIYAKVLPTRGEGGVVLRFTSLPAEAGKLVERQLIQS